MGCSIRAQANIIECKHPRRTSLLPFMLKNYIGPEIETLSGIGSCEAPIDFIPSVQENSVRPSSNLQGEKQMESLATVSVLDTLPRGVKVKRIGSGD